MRAEDILYFWFTEAGEAAWWKKSKEFDEIVRRRFLDTFEKAALGEFAHWRDRPRGRLAEIILLDQFPRNMFRDTPRAFATDGMALALSQEAVRAGAGQGLSGDERAFLYMPHMHSESLHVHHEAVRLFSEPGLEEQLDFERRHKAIIKRFGRYPHRNAILGRVSTEEEEEFLKEPGSSF